MILLLFCLLTGYYSDFIAVVATVEWILEAVTLPPILGSWLADWLLR